MLVRLSKAQERVLDAAVALIAENGVHGTSLQMIADTIGVTKAAVYHQYRTKDQIVLAVVERELLGLEQALDSAADEPDRLRARRLLLDRVLELVVSRRRVAVLLQSDPVIVKLLAQHEPFQRLLERLFAVLVGEDDTAPPVVQLALLSAALVGGVMHPWVQDLDDATLAAEMTSFTARFFHIE